MPRRIIIELAERVQRLRASSAVEMARLIERRARGRRELLRLDAEDCGYAPPRFAWIGSGGEEAAARWMERRFRRETPSACDVLLVRGSFSPATLVALAFVNPGGAVALPDPGRPSLRTAALLAGGAPVAEGRGGSADAFDFDGVAASRRSDPHVRLRFVAPCSPPAGLPNSLADLDAWVRACAATNTILCADLSSLLIDMTLSTRPGAPAESEASSHPEWESPAAMPGAATPTLLGHPAGAAVGLEIVTFDELFGAGKSPFAIIAGHRDLVAGVRRVAAALGLDTTAPSSLALAPALDEVDRLAASASDAHRDRRHALADGLQRLGFRTQLPAAGLWHFSAAPRGYQSLPFARMLLRKAGILVKPGIDFGEAGEGGFAISLATPRDTLLRALGRLEELAPRTFRLRRQLARARRAPAR
jgi:LL-diaminopimelate aminotransferase